ncbi:hypothetical protein SAMN05443668_12481 [Cryptosporangium aurantiacum]|uniref:Uncharacterized protein n=1 Tax=Cryptosporangium aurantiacum TaxID=134849 RepID=A0A1M7RMJ0_9ACTN|nr:hypothetical protein SAMN05443668_12481 [Cryptosporangium aurantiacum]
MNTSGSLSRSALSPSTCAATAFQVVSGAFPDPRRPGKAAPFGLAIAAPTGPAPPGAAARHLG